MTGIVRSLRSAVTASAGPETGGAPAHAGRIKPVGMTGKKHTADSRAKMMLARLSGPVRDNQLANLAKQFRKRGKRISVKSWAGIDDDFDDWSAE